MPVEWQGEHKLLGNAKEDFERAAYEAWKSVPQIRRVWNAAQERVGGGCSRHAGGEPGLQEVEEIGAPFAGEQLSLLAVGVVPQRCDAVFGGVVQVGRS